MIINLNLIENVNRYLQLINNKYDRKNIKSEI